MASYHRRGVCKGIPSRPATLLVVSCGADGQLQSTVISGGNKHRYSCDDAPNEGVFIIFEDRALQIAAPPCEQRKCKNICCCDTSCHSAKIHSNQSNIKKRKIAWSMWRKPCQNCLFNWLSLYPAAEAAHQRGMQFLKHPRTLTWSKSNGRHSFHYDDELEEDIVCSNQNGPCAGSRDFIPPCPPTKFQWMKDAWNDFTAAGSYKPDCVIGLSDSEDESCDDQSSNDDNDAGNDSEWDDLDIPCKDLTEARDGKSTDEFDTIDDLIEEGEFPRLRKGCATKAGVQPTRQERKPKPKPTPMPVCNDDEDQNCCEDGDAPAPVIIPPKNMSIGRGLVRPADSQVPDAPRPGSGNATSSAAVDSPHTTTTTTAAPSLLKHKRSHDDFAASLWDAMNSELLPAEDLPRMPKYQKRGPSRPCAGDDDRHHRRRGSAVRRFPMSQIGGGLTSQKLLVV
ncbi:Glutamate--tRNA ligase mitochondrial [Hypoxylon texense]